MGEGDEVGVRVATHGDKEFWTSVAIFVSKDENLTKAHARWLEARIVRDLRTGGRAILDNVKDPVGGRLPESDGADMETFLENVYLLLPVLGLDVARQGTGGTGATGAPAAVADPAQLTLELKWKDVTATCEIRDGGFVVKAGSTASSTDVPSQADWVRNLRAQLVKTGVLIPKSGVGQLMFAADFRFDSPSAAAAVVAGTGLNGQTAWTVKGKAVTYKEWKEKQAAI